MQTRVIADRLEIDHISDAITKAMESLGYALIGSTTKPSRSNSSDRICYLNFVPQSTYQTINDEL